MANVMPKPLMPAMYINKEISRKVFDSKKLSDFGTLISSSLLAPLAGAGVDIFLINYNRIRERKHGKKRSSRRQKAQTFDKTFVCLKISYMLFLSF